MNDSTKQDASDKNPEKARHIEAASMSAGEMLKAVGKHNLLAGRPFHIIIRSSEGPSEKEPEHQ